jgi:hypothetical protein
MFTFYLASGFAILVCLAGALVTLLFRPKAEGDWWLIAFLFSLSINAVYALVNPIVTGWTQDYSHVQTTDFLSRLIAVAGYICLFLFALKRRRSPSAHL